MFWKKKKFNALVSFPKSGRTWLRVMLDGLNIDLHYSHAHSGHRGGRHIQSLDTSASKNYSKVVFLHRDPRDTVVSGYHQKTKRLSGYDGTISEFIRDPRHGVIKILRFNKMWIDLAKKSDNFIVVSYEQLQEDTVGTLVRITRFFDYEPDIDKIEKIVEESRFSNMRSREETGEFAGKYGTALTPKNTEDKNSFKVRKGIVGGYADELSDADIEYCNHCIETYR